MKARPTPNGTTRRRKGFFKLADTFGSTTPLTQQPVNSGPDLNTDSLLARQRRLEDMAIARALRIAAYRLLDVAREGRDLTAAELWALGYKLECDADRVEMLAGE
jgi:hypothetical protein